MYIQGNHVKVRVSWSETICIRMYIYIYIYANTGQSCESACQLETRHTLTYLCTYVYIYTYTYIYIHMYMNIHMYIRAIMKRSVSLRARLGTHLHT